MKTESSQKTTEVPKQNAVRSREAEAIAASLKLASSSTPKQAEQTIKQKPTKTEKSSIKKHLVENKPVVPREVEAKPHPKNTALIVAKPAATLEGEKQTLPEAFTQTQAEANDNHVHKSPEPDITLKEVMDESSDHSETLDFENVPPTIELSPDDFDTAETGLLINSEVAFDDETLETFTQLMELINTGEAPLLVDDTAMVEDEVILFNEAAKAPERLSFEEFATTQSDQISALDTEEVRALANERPLEESLVCLVSLFEEAPGDNENMMKLVNDLSESFSRINERKQETEAIRITPEITQKLLSLLSQIGYKNPREVLLEFITRHDLEFLVQALRYLAQLAHQDNQHELMPIKPSSSLLRNTAEPLHSRIGKAVLGFTRTDLAAA